MMFADRELVLGSEAARRLGLSRERVRQLAADPRQAFPAPIGRYSTGGDPRADRIVWDWAEVERWGHAHGTLGCGDRLARCPRRAVERCHPRHTRFGGGGF